MSEQPPEPGPKNGTPDPRLMPVIRIVVEVRQMPDGEQTNVQANVPPGVCVTALSNAIVAVARQGWTPAEEKLIMPAVGALPKPPIPGPGSVKRF